MNSDELSCIDEVYSKIKAEEEEESRFTMVGKDGDSSVERKDTERC